VQWRRRALPWCNNGEIPRLPKGFKSDWPSVQLTDSQFVRAQLSEKHAHTSIRILRANGHRCADRRGGKTWTPDEEQKLIEMVDGGIARPVVAKTLSRTVAAIEGRAERYQILADTRSRAAGLRARAHPSAELQFEGRSRVFRVAECPMRSHPRCRPRCRTCLGPMSSRVREKPPCCVSCVMR
jgi:hypothetical protein